MRGYIHTSKHQLSNFLQLEHMYKFFKLLSQDSILKRHMCTHYDKLNSDVVDVEHENRVNKKFVSSFKIKSFIYKYKKG